MLLKSLYSAVKGPSGLADVAPGIPSKKAMALMRRDLVLNDPATKRRFLRGALYHYLVDSLGWTPTQAVQGIQESRVDDRAVLEVELK